MPGATIATRRRTSGRETAIEFTHRLATPDDIPVLRALVNASIDELQRGFLDDDQIRSSHSIMGIDRQLIDDGTYFVVEHDGRIVGCGGWSRRATLYGGDHSGGRDVALLDPATDSARVRAMYTHPDFTRRGVGRLILSLCERAAAAEGFTSLQLAATLAGLPLYDSYGFETLGRGGDSSGGAPMPIVHMRKAIDSAG